MEIQIVLDKEQGYTAMIKELSITTQGDSRDTLLFNIKEALLCHYEAADQNPKIGIANQDLRFYFDMKSMINAPQL